MDKKILAIVGTYRKSGATDSAVDAILAAASGFGAETEKIYLIDKHIEFCTNCRSCTQSAGQARGKCIHNDDVEAILSKIESADGLVFASPVNFFNVTAVTRRFIERLVAYAEWPWGTGAPKTRNRKLTKKSVIVTATAMPAFMGRFLTGAVRILKIVSKLLGAKPVSTIFIGTASLHKTQPLSGGIIKKCNNAGRLLAR